MAAHDKEKALNKQADIVYSVLQTIVNTFPEKSGDVASIRKEIQFYFKKQIEADTSGIEELKHLKIFTDETILNITIEYVCFDVGVIQEFTWNILTGEIIN